ncbi:hypothetical protein [Dehalogenimonas etheniformans]|nr:hypothetical protein [Dehalogenimonas etheniformans]
MFLILLGKVVAEGFAMGPLLSVVVALAMLGVYLLITSGDKK